MSGKTRHRLAWLLLLLPVAALIWPPIYNRIEPRVFGVPFFYAWQTGWIALSAVITAIAGRLTRAPLP